MDFDNLHLWIAFGSIILILLILDLGVFHRKAHAIKTKEAAIWTVVWISVALLFNLAIYYWKGSEVALEYLTGYLIEKSLSVDNLFVFVMIFSAFCVAPEHQHRILFWGIIGAIIMRGVLIASGAFLMERFFWIAYVFGAFLIFVGIKLWVKRGSQPNPERNPLVRLAKRCLPIASDSKECKFVLKRDGKLLLTPLFLVLLTVETTDLVFALDSIPAIFAITTDPFVIFTSNIFAILGLRSLYFLLAGVVNKFHYLQTSLAFILTFVGVKMMIGHFFKIPVIISLTVIVVALVAGVVASLVRAKRLKKETLPVTLPAEGDIA